MPKNRTTSKDNFLKELGLKLKELREKKGLSQFQLAIEAEIPKNQVGRIERGQINTSVYNLKRISEALGISLVDLLKD